MNTIKNNWYTAYFEDGNILDYQARNLGDAREKAKTYGVEYFPESKLRVSSVTPRPVRRSRNRSKNVKVKTP